MKYAVTCAKARSYSVAASSLKVSSPAILSPLHTADHPLYSEEPPGGSTDQIAEIRAEWATPCNRGSRLPSSQISPHSSNSRTPSAVIATLFGGSPAPTNHPLTSA